MTKFSLSKKPVKEEWKLLLLTPKQLGADALKQGDRKRQRECGGTYRLGCRLTPKIAAAPNARLCWTLFAEVAARASRPLLFIQSALMISSGTGMTALLRPPSPAIIHSAIPWLKDTCIVWVASEVGFNSYFFEILNPHFFCWKY